MPPAPDGRYRAAAPEHSVAHKFPVTTTLRATAQAFVNQGVNLSLSRSTTPRPAARFAEAARLDPTCAMAYWGQALVLGPNINAPMDADATSRRRCALRRPGACALGSRRAPRERALHRRARPGATDGNAADTDGAPTRAYADAMRDGTRGASRPISTRRRCGRSRRWTCDRGTTGGPTARRTRARARSARRIEECDRAATPNHPGALHFYIHLLEPTPTRAERPSAAADRLLPLMPARRATWSTCRRTSTSASAATPTRSRSNAARDRRRRGLHHAVPRAGPLPDGLLPAQPALPVVRGHRCEGRSSWRSRRRGRRRRKVSDSALAATAAAGGLPRGAVVRAHALRPLGRDAGRAGTAAPRTATCTGTWTYARGLALIGKGHRHDGRRACSARCRAIAAATSARTSRCSRPTPRTRILSRGARDAVRARLAAATGDPDAAITHLQHAVLLEDALIVHRARGVALPAAAGARRRAAGRGPSARGRDRLLAGPAASHPENGWSLYGLAQAQEAQGRTGEAAETRARFNRRGRRRTSSSPLARVAPQ